MDWAGALIDMLFDNLIVFPLFKDRTISVYNCNINNDLLGVTLYCPDVNVPYGQTYDILTEAICEIMDNLSEETMIFFGIHF